MSIDPQVHRKAFSSDPTGATREGFTGGRSALPVPLPAVALSSHRLIVVGTSGQLSKQLFVPSTSIFHGRQFRIGQRNVLAQTQQIRLAPASHLILRMRRQILSP